MEKLHRWMRESSGPQQSSQEESTTVRIPVEVNIRKPSASRSE